MSGGERTDERQRKRGRSPFSYIASPFLRSLTPPHYFKFAGATQHHEKQEIKERSTHKMSSAVLPFEFWFAKNGETLKFPGPDTAKPAYLCFQNWNKAAAIKARNSAMIQSCSY
jgi:hypothetical protein